MIVARRAEGWRIVRSAATQSRQDLFHLQQELLGHLARKAMPHQYALNYQVLTMGWHGVGGHQPTALTEQLCHLIEREG